MMGDLDVLKQPFTHQRRQSHQNAVQIFTGENYCGYESGRNHHSRLSRGSYGILNLSPLGSIDSRYKKIVPNWMTHPSLSSMTKTWLLWQVGGGSWLVFFLSTYPLYARVRSFAISACRALAYFDNAETLPMPNMLDTTPWNIMKKFLENQAVLAGGMKLYDLWE